MNPRVFALSVVFLNEGAPGWVAQCLEYDIAAQGKTIELAHKALECTIIGQIAVDVCHKQEPLSDIKQAPKEYWEKFEKGFSIQARRPYRIPDSVPMKISASADDTRVYA